MHTTHPDTAEARSLFKASPKDSHPLHFPNHIPQMLHLADAEIAAIPAARELAHALGLSLQHIPASGTDGRVTLLDVYQYASSNSATPQPTAISTTPLDTHTFAQVVQQWQALAQHHAWSLDPFWLWVKLIWQGAHLHSTHLHSTHLHSALPPEQPRFWHIQQAEQHYTFDVTQAVPSLRSLTQTIPIAQQLHAQLTCQINPHHPHATLSWSGRLPSAACVASIVQLLQDPHALWQIP